jgi:hypothetical protein
VRHLITFDFDFHPADHFVISAHLLIDTFRSSFWLKEKQWFVAYETNLSHIFTVPHFAPTGVYYSTMSSSRELIHSTVSPDQSPLNDCISNLEIMNSSDVPSPSDTFMHVKILSIPNAKIFDQLNLNIDLTQVECLKLTDTISIAELERIIPHILPRIDELHLTALPKGYRRKLGGITHIRTLHIGTVNCAFRLYRQFPCIEHLYIGNVKSYRQIRSILDQSKSHLSHVSLNWIPGIQSEESFQLVQTSLKRDQDELNFTYQCCSQSVPSIHLWIRNNSEQVSLFHLLKIDDVDIYRIIVSHSQYIT